MAHHDDLPSFFPLDDYRTMRPSRTLSPTRHIEGWNDPNGGRDSTFLRHDDLSNMPETAPLLPGGSETRNYTTHESSPNPLRFPPHSQPVSTSYRSRSLERNPRGGSIPQRRHTAQKAAPAFAKVFVRYSRLQPSSRSPFVTVMSQG